MSPARTSTEKLQKVLARAGLGSRRQLEGWIRAGRVSVNDAPAGVGARIGPEDVVRVDGRRVSLPAARPRGARVLRYHKRVGELCTRRREPGRPTVFDRLPRLREGRWVAVGRLDVNSSGLLLFTDDGELAHRLMHPSAGVEREYAVRVRGEITPDTLRRLRRGVALDDGPARFERIVESGGEGANRWFHVVLREGRNREVRRLWASQGAQVSRLVRVRLAGVTLPRGLPAGRWDELGPQEVAALEAAASAARSAR